jgi:hypothetical protein
MKINNGPQLTFAILTGLALTGAILLFSRSSAAKGVTPGGMPAPVPIPTPDPNVRLWLYRAFIIQLTAVPDQGYTWGVWDKDADRAVVPPTAVGSMPTTDLAALDEARAWIDTFYGGT